MGGGCVFVLDDLDFLCLNVGGAVLVEEGWKVSGHRGSFAWECLLEEL